MKKLFAILAFVFLCFSSNAGAQLAPIDPTPNIQLNRPPYIAGSWGESFNQNWNKLDALFPNGTVVPFTILDEGSGLTQRLSINFTGSGVTCADNSGLQRTDCTINGSGDAITLQGRALSATTPGSGQVIKWNGSQWVPADDATGGSPPFSLIGSGTNNAAVLVCGSGCSFTVSGSGTNTATGVTGLTASRALETSAGGVLQPSTVTAAELANVGGTTSAIQTQLNAKEATANKNAASGYAGLDSGSRIAKAQGFSATVYNDQANSYTAGVKQTVVHSATTAGLNINPATGDPSTPSNGDIWYNSTTGKFRKFEGGSTTDLDTTGGSVAFSAITAGTNANALLVSGSLGISGGGTISANRYNGNALVAIADGGSNAATAAAARTNFGLVIGTDVQAFDADLSALAANSTNGFWARTGAGTGAARTILGTTGNVTVTGGDGSANPTIDLGATAVQTDQANTYTTGAQDMSAASSFRLPTAAGLAPTTNGQAAYNSTDNMLHAAQSSADAKIPQFTITPANDDCVKWVVSGSNYKLGSAGAACGSGGGGVSGLTTGTIPKAASSTTLNDSAIVQDADSINTSLPMEINCGAGCLFGMDTTIFATTLKTWGYPANVSSTFVGNDTTQVLTNKTVDSEGTGNVLTTVDYWDYDLAACVGGTASQVQNTGIIGAPTPTCHTGSNRVTASLSFPDTDGDNGIFLSRLLPAGWAGSFDAKIIWWTTATTNAAVFQVATSCYAIGEADDAAFNTASTVTSTAQGTASRPNIATLTGITTTGCAAGELMRIKFFRNRTHASDTLAAALNVEKVVFVARQTK